MFPISQNLCDVLRKQISSIALTKIKTHYIQYAYNIHTVMYLICIILWEGTVEVHILIQPGARSLEGVSVKWDTKGYKQVRKGRK
jgi:hypothetical protein